MSNQQPNKPGRGTHIFNLLAMAAISSLLSQGNVVAQTTQLETDAAKLYLHAAQLVDDNRNANIQSPANSNLMFEEYPPYPPQWQQLESADIAANAEIRKLAHEARSIDHANWPVLTAPKPDFTYLNEVRSLTNDIADAALWQHLHGNDAAAIATLLDQWHLAKLVANSSDKKIVCLLVSVGMDAMASQRLQVITAGVVLTEDPHNEKDLQFEKARELIALLLKHPDARTQSDDYIQAETKAGRDLALPMDKERLAKFAQTCHRAYAERDLAAMSLACHLFRFDTRHWPTSLNDLKRYLPQIPIDPWGDGKQTLGYALIKAGLPDGSDRPLVYCRHMAKGALFCRKDVPAYGYYQGTGGQFRDVAAWMPKDPHASATTQQVD